jgi:hypothetical protein
LEVGALTPALAYAQLDELLATAARQVQARAVAQNDDVFSVKERMQLFDAFQVHNRGTADAQEVVGPEWRLDKA